MSPLPLMLLALALGFTLGTLYLAALRRSVLALVAARRSIAWLASMLLLRLAGAAAALTAIAWWGSWRALVAALVGFLASRAMLLRDARAEHGR